MRATHRPNPLHRIEKWTGKYFRRAALWEVGSYLLIPHHSGEPLCDALNWQIDCLEQVERVKDAAEQMALAAAAGEQATNNPMPHGDPMPADGNDYEMEDAAAQSSAAEDSQEDLEFERFLNAAHQRRNNEDVYPPAATGFAETSGTFDPDDAAVGIEEDDDVLELPAYLDGLDAGTGTVPRSDALQNSYVRVVHVNAIHHLAMVSCECRGNGTLPLDLMARRMAPASFDRIRTLFSGQLLDYFRLCNLELKASAYQFYQLLRRMTLPTAPAEVVNLYNEFRRMTRLWRWMKKLKWSGFGHHKRDPNNVANGELAVYCPACPQPGVNIPPNWKHDENR